MSKLLIVIPAYNEEANIVKVVNGIVITRQAEELPAV